MRIRIKFGVGSRPRKKRIEIACVGTHDFAVDDVVMVETYRYVVTNVGISALKLRRFWPHDYVWLAFKMAVKGAIGWTLKIAQRGKDWRSSKS